MLGLGETRGRTCDEMRGLAIAFVLTPVDDLVPVARSARVVLPRENWLAGVGQQAPAGGVSFAQRSSLQLDNRGC